MAEGAVIFDVDGVLLELTDDEAELFFVPFEKYLDTRKLSRDWSSYRIRNDENILEEILEGNGISPDLKQSLIKDYLSLLNESLKSQRVVTIPLSGSAQLLSQLAQNWVLGIATANFRDAAKLRLQSAGMWEPVSRHAFGADGGGHKHEIVARAITSMGLPPERIVYIGDNLNDLEAGRRNGVHFIGFSTDATRRDQLRAAGAAILTSNHTENASLINQLLA